MRMRACVVACFAGILTVTTGALAQDAPQPAKPAAAPPAAEGTLPEVVVDTAAKPKAAAAKKKTAKSKGIGQSTGTPAASAEQTKATSDKAETAYGPVKGYAATRSATGIKTDTPITEIPQSISVVGREEMRDQGAQTLQETLQYTAGVIADGYGLDSRTDTSFIRGTEAAEYLDGMRRTFSYYVYNYRIDPYFMERVEVLRGPASVLYGTAPVGGILNAVTRRPQEEQASEITVEYGTYDFKQVKFDTTGSLTPDGKWTYRLTGLARDADTQVDFVEDDRYAIAPAITYRPTANTSITLLSHFRDDHTGSTAQFLPHIGTIFPNVNGMHIPSNRFIGEPGEDRYDTKAASGTLLVDHKFDETFRLRHATRYSDIHNDYVTSYPGFFASSPQFPVPDYVDADQTKMYRIKGVTIADTQMWDSDTNLEAKVQTGALGHKILGGFDYAQFDAQSWNGSALNAVPFDVYNPVYGQPEFLIGFDCNGVLHGLNSPPLPEVPVCRDPDQSVTQKGVYLQDQMRLDNWIAVVGLRHDWLENTQDGTQEDEATTYRAGLMYELAFGLTPYISYAQSFVPVVADTFDNRPLNPQQGEMYEAGFKYQPDGADFILTGAVYDIAESNRLSSDPVNPGFSVQGGAVSIRGFEIEGKGNLTKNIQMIAAYSYTDAEYTGGDQAGFHVESVPYHLASLWGVYSFDTGTLKGWSVGAGVRYIGASWDGEDDFQTPAVTLFDGMLAYETDTWRWSLNAKNLEDEFFYSTCLARGDCFAATRRTITTGLTYKF